MKNHFVFSSSVFSSLKDVLKDENMTIDEDKVLEEFCAGTLQELLSGLEFAWEKSDIKYNLDHLERIKAMNRDVVVTANESEEDKLGLDIRMKYLLAKKRKLWLLRQQDEERMKQLTSKLEVYNNDLREHNLLKAQNLRKLEENVIRFNEIENALSLSYENISNKNSENCFLAEKMHVAAWLNCLRRHVLLRWLVRNQ